jgi:hypothetical protein
MPLDVQHAAHCIIGTDYPPPIVDHIESVRRATSEFARVKGLAETKAQAAAVYEKHGSRKRPAPHAVPPSKRVCDDTTDASLDAADSPLNETGGAADASGGHASELVAGAAAPFALEVAASGRAKCRLCGDAIAKGTSKVSTSAWTRAWRRPPPGHAAHAHTNTHTHTHTHTLRTRTRTHTHAHARPRTHTHAHARTR